MKLYDIIMKCEYEGSDDGIHIVTYNKGERYSIGETLYKCFKAMDLIKDYEEPKAPAQPIPEPPVEKEEEKEDEKTEKVEEKKEEKAVTDYSNKAVKPNSNKGTGKGSKKK